MKQRVEEMEKEAKKLRELQAAAEADAGGDAHEQMEAEDDKTLSDSRSVYVGNVRHIILAHPGPLYLTTKTG